MQTLSSIEIDMVGGAISENQCIGVFTLGGALIGGAISAYGTAGWGTSQGWGLGGMLGNAGGQLLCRYIMTE